MLSTQNAAQLLGVSEQRIRKMLATGQLEGSKLGRSWMVSEQSIQERKQAGIRPGRPKKQEPVYTRPLPDVEQAHRIFDEVQHVLNGCYDATFLNLARSPQEQEFWIRTADLLLQQKQRELIAAGVY